MLICTDPILQEYLKKDHVTAAVFDSVLDDAQKQEMLESLDRFMAGWFLDRSGRDFTEYDGVSIGAVLYGELLGLFYLLYHFTWIIQQWKSGSSLRLYQSVSCKVPPAVEDLIRHVGGDVITTSYTYPYLCFRKNLAGKHGATVARQSISYEML